MRNNFFCNIGTNLQETIPHSNCDEYKQYLPHATVHSFYLTPVEYDDVLKEIKRVNPKKSSGVDNIGGKILQLCPEIFAYNLTKIFNKSITAGVYPNELKIAKVIALFKKGDKHVANNYRPISLLSVFNKIFERLIAKKIVKYFESRLLLYDYQFGFRKRYSTFLALIECTDSIRRLIDEGKLVSCSCCV